MVRMLLTAIIMFIKFNQALTTASLSAGGCPKYQRASTFDKVSP